MPLSKKGAMNDIIIVAGVFDMHAGFGDAPFVALVGLILAGGDLFEAFDGFGHEVPVAADGAGLADGGLHGDIFGEFITQRDFQEAGAAGSPVISR